LSYWSDADAPIQTELAFACLITKSNCNPVHAHCHIGMVASGQIAIGEAIRQPISGQIATVRRLLVGDDERQVAVAGERAMLMLDSETSLANGDVIAKATQPLEVTDQFEATIVWGQLEPGMVGRTYRICLANQWADVTITAIKFRLNTETHTHEACRELTHDDVAVCNMALSRSLVFEGYKRHQALGHFVLFDRFSHLSIGAGGVNHSLRRGQNVHRQALSISRREREILNGHAGKVIWFTGLSGSGKSTAANALEKELHAQGKHTYLLDGDNIRQGLNKDLGFTDADRVENIRRVAETAKLMMDAGLIVMTAFISPFRAEREMARQLVGDENFIEVYVDTPLDVCEQRDPKGLYKKARNGQIPNMTGVNSPYEEPPSPDIRLTPTTPVSVILTLLED
jgi:bifunctional enzyme CysN/CysC